MDISSFLLAFVQSHLWVSIGLMALGCMVVLAQAIVPLTPTKSDDAILEAVEKNSMGKAILNFVLAFAPIQKK